VCGICGIASIERLEGSGESGVRRMCEVLRHRGPDDEGYFVGQQVALGARRLSIIDLETGHQPFSNEDASLWLVANGEIYNHLGLRSELEKKGHVFRSHADTEVIVHAFEEYGAECVERFNGMFAFAIWDEDRRRLLLCRDRLGIKPLYYWTDGSTLVFGSEARAVVAHPQVPTKIDLVALDQFLTWEYLPGDRAIFKGVRKLPPGHQLVFAQGKLVERPYWELPVLETPRGERECVDVLLQLLRDAVRVRLMSDVPLGAALSGGLDSSTVVGFATEAMPSELPTFSIGFEDATYDERPYSRAVADYLGTDHTEDVLGSDVVFLAERLVRGLDEPLGDFSILPTYLLSRLAGRSVKVLLCGDGGDELFAGYDTYVAQYVDRLYRWLPARVRQRSLPRLMRRVPPRRAKKGLVNKAKRFVEGAALDPSLRHARWMVFCGEKERAALYGPEMRALVGSRDPAAAIVRHFNEASVRPPLCQQQVVDIKTYLANDILTKVDRMTMSASVEARVPFLDHRIVEFAVNLPAGMKLRLGERKVLLRRAVVDRLPAAVLTRPKQGFGMPMKQWLRGPLRELMTDVLSSEPLGREGYFQPQCVERWMTEHLDERADHSHRLWSLMVFSLWRRSLAREGSWSADA
jgi:asparagine synthase (glutamine-hydrolysing)